MVDLNNAVLVADVSGWQQGNLTPLADDGFKAVIIKVAEGLSPSNNVRREQAETALAAGMVVVGKYNFSLDGNPGASECEVTDAQLDGLPVQRLVIDAEASTIGGVQRPPPSAAQVISFGRRARQLHPGVKPLLYASESVIANQYNVAEVADLFDCWYAQYRDYTPRTWPWKDADATLGPFNEIIGWQFTSTFPSSIGGIDASVFDPAILEGDDMTPEEVDARIEQYVYGTLPVYGLSRADAHVERYVFGQTVYGVSRVEAAVLGAMTKLKAEILKRLGL